MLIPRQQQTRWPALTMAVLFLGYAAGKAVYASQSRLGFPSGPVPTVADHAQYADAVMGVAAAQWSAAATGVVAAVVALATVTRVGRAVPRPLMLAALGLTALAFAAGAAVLVLDGFVGLGVGWQWRHGVFGVLALYVTVRMVVSYVQATRPAERHRGDERRGTPQRDASALGGATRDREAARPHAAGHRRR
ncbi:hypothetical protein GCM10023169_26140 [Georgenia halophila]|uniref:DUF998 domain-containing protein n=1 Tax=Georgenia halophila TaxID=620889 RepID=A0ABP8LCX3_9MICO